MYFKKNNYNFLIIFLIGFILRAFSIFLFGDKIIDNEWGVILANFETNKVFGFRSFEAVVLPTVFMPPLYLFFLFFLKKIYFLSSGYVEFVLCIQLIISMLGAYFLYKLLKIYFSDILSLLGLTIYIFFPLNVYSVSQISSITLNLFFIVCYLLNLIFFIKYKEKKNLIFFSILSALLILIRGEFFVFYFMTILFLVSTKVNLKNIILCLIITFFIISPYIYRNYVTFNEITITKSFGYNLWKGNNKFSKSEGYEKIHDEIFKARIEKLDKNDQYDIEIDNLYKNEAFKNLKNNPKKYLKLFIKKLFSFFILDLDSTYPNYYHILHLFPKIVIGTSSFIGMLCSFKRFNDFTLFGIFYLFYALLFSIFFILPRYSLIFLPLQILLTLNLLNVARLKK